MCVQCKFIECCKNGHLDDAKRLYQIGIDTNSPINIHTYNESAFRQSCDRDI